MQVLIQSMNGLLSNLTLPNTFRLLFNKQTKWKNIKSTNLTVHRIRAYVCGNFSTCKLWATYKGFGILSKTNHGKYSDDNNVESLTTLPKVCICFPYAVSALIISESTGKYTQRFVHSLCGSKEDDKIR